MRKESFQVFLVWVPEDTGTSLRREINAVWREHGWYYEFNLGCGELVSGDKDPVLYIHPSTPGHLWCLRFPQTKQFTTSLQTHLGVILFGSHILHLELVLDLKGSVHQSTSSPHHHFRCPSQTARPQFTGNFCLFPGKDHDPLQI